MTVFQNNFPSLSLTISALSFPCCSHLSSSPFMFTLPPNFLTSVPFPPYFLYFHLTSSPSGHFHIISSPSVCCLTSLSFLPLPIPSVHLDLETSWESAQRGKKVHVQGHSPSGYGDPARLHRRVCPVSFRERRRRGLLHGASEEREPRLGSGLLPHAEREPAKCSLQVLFTCPQSDLS